MFLQMSAPRADNSPLRYRGCTATVRRRGNIRTTPIAEVLVTRRDHRFAGRRPPAPSRFVHLELDADAHAGIACWSGGPTQWAHFTVAVAYDLHYRDIREAMSGGIEKRTLVAIAAAMARFADWGTGRNCWPSNATLAARTGFCERTVQRARSCLRLLGVATEVVRGRQRTYGERMASWRMGDRSRGWASVWALHDNKQLNGVIYKLSPHLERSPVTTRNSPCRELVTTHTGAVRARQGVATRRRSLDADGQRLARQWRSHPKAPPWCRRYSAGAWSSMLAGPAREGWTAEDLNAAVRDWLIGGHHIPDHPPRPIGLLGAVLAAYVAHNCLSVRPTVSDEAAAFAAAQLAGEQRAEREHRRAREREEFARGREIGQEALSGRGRAAVREVLDAVRRRTPAG